MNPIVDVAVLGGGVAGSAAAIRLAQLGWSTLLVDQAKFPRHKVCGEFLSPEARSMLASLGISLSSEESALQPSAMSYARIVLPSGGSLRLPLPGTALGISRFALDDELHRAAASSGADVVTQTAVTDVTAADKGYVVRLKRDSCTEAVTARIVIAAWGRHPRAGLPGCKERNGPFHIGVKAHYEGIKQEGEASVELYVFHGGYVGVAPIERGRVNVSALMTRAAFHSAGGSAEAAFLYAARLHPLFGERLTHSTLVPGTMTTTSPVYTNRRLAAWDKLPHIGDAAVMIPPLCGDGMAMALRSAELCARLTHEYLRGSLTLAQFQCAYSMELRREFYWPVHIGRLCQALLANPISARMVLGIGRLIPALASAAVKATRLREQTYS